MLNTSISYSRELSNLAKVYIDNKKYSGCNNSFIFKLTIFHNICLKANILFKVKMKTFSTMFKGLTLDYYYSNISISAVTMNFD